MHRWDGRCLEEDRVKSKKKETVASVNRAHHHITHTHPISIHTHGHDAKQNSRGVCRGARGEGGERCSMDIDWFEKQRNNV